MICPVPNPPSHERAWRERFAITDVVSAYGMTEVNIPLYGRLGTSRPSTAGLVLDRWFEVQVRDPDTDDPLPAGEVGEIMVRPRIPFGFMSGYAGLPEATVTAWRNFWFHTGDSGTMDEDGWSPSSTAPKTASGGAGRTSPPSRWRAPSPAAKAWPRSRRMPCRRVPKAPRTR